MPYLTPQERRIAKLVCEDRCSKEIAHALGISKSTVNYHRLNVGKKLEASSPITFYRRCMEEGIVDPPQKHDLSRN